MGLCKQGATNYIDAATQDVKLIMIFNKINVIDHWVVYCTNIANSSESCTTEGDECIGVDRR